MKTVLITGCSSGFGRGMVDEFLQRGWHVVATMRNAAERHEILAHPLERYGSRLTVLSLDVTDAEERQAIAEFVRDRGSLDCLINNAGDRIFGALENLSESQLCYQMKVNFLGAAFLTRSLLPYLRATRGTVIFVSSTFGYVGFPLTSAYCASKFALEGLAESLYYELKPHGVHVGILEPGASKTNFGSGAKWGNQDLAVYQTQTYNYHRLKAQLSAKAADNTQRVAQTAADVAEGKSRALRVQVGRDAAIAHLLQRTMPAWVQHIVLGRLYHQLFLTQEET